MSASESVTPFIAGIALAVAFAAPASAQQTTREPQSGRRSDVITREEIEAVQVEDAYQVVLRLRPEFLSRAARSKPSAGLSATNSTPSDDPDEVGRNFDAQSRPAAGGFVTATRRAPDPDAPEFDRGGSGRAAQAPAGGRTAQAPASGGGFAGSMARAGDRTPPPGAAGGRFGTRSTVVVYVGNMQLGGIEELTTLPAVSLQEIRFLSASEAQMRFGSQHGAMVILVTLK